MYHRRLHPAFQEVADGDRVTLQGELGRVGPVDHRMVKVPAAPVLTPQQVLDHEHVQAIGYLQPTDEILAELGYSPAAITELHTSRVV